MEHRWGRRRPTNVRVHFLTLPNAEGVGRVTNISSTGAYLETRVPLRKLSIVYLEVVDSGTREGAGDRLAATVVRTDARGAGLEWCEFAASMTGVYARLLDGRGHLSPSNR